MVGTTTTHIQKNALDNVFASLDPKSLILSQFSNDSNKPNLLQLQTESFVLERGARYDAYAELRESKLRMRNRKAQEQEQQEERESNLSPPKKQVKFQGSFPNTRKGSSVLAQSVPDFSATLRKENRKPVGMLPPTMEASRTPPPPTKNSKMYGGGKSGVGSRSANSAAEKRGGLMVARKSYANVEELKGLSMAASNAIHGENRGTRVTRGTSSKTVLGYRQY